MLPVRRLEKLVMGYSAYNSEGNKVRKTNNTQA